MAIAEILLETFDDEILKTRRTLERVPEDKAEWAPHGKSMKMGRLAMHCATIPIFGYYILEDDGMDMAKSTRPRFDLTFTNREKLLVSLEECAAKCRASLAATSDEAMQKNWRFSFGDQVISDMPRGKTFRVMFADHMVHHTAQLGVYLRMLEVPVPALYGPSADEQWG